MDGDDGIFIDWLSLWQFHEQHAPINSGAIITYDGSGRAVFERYRSSRIQGSHATGCAVKSDGQTVVGSGNFGRLNRPDNLFGFDPQTVLRRANEALAFAGLPRFLSAADSRDGGDWYKEGLRYPGAVGLVGPGSPQATPRGRLNLSRVDITRNFECGGLAAARSVIRAISGKSISRVKKGVGGDASVWWSNTRYMLKVYIKALEMEAHGTNSGAAYDYAVEHGIVRLELELKRRELADLGWSDFDAFVEAWDMGKVQQLFSDYEKVLQLGAISNHAEFLDSLPQRLRVTASAFLAGQDVRALMSRATFFRYRRALLDYGIDIADERPEQLNVAVRTVTLEPVTAPDWYWQNERAA